MQLLPINLMIMIAWAIVSDDFSLLNLFGGYVAGFVALYPFTELYDGSRYHDRTVAAIWLFLHFVYDLVLSSLQVVNAVLFRTHRGRSRFVEVPLEVRSQFGVMLVANMISLTPGTLSVDVDPAGERLLIHAMFADDPEAVVADIKTGLERRVMRVVE